MKAELLNLIESYRTSVCEAVRLLREAGVALPSDAKEWSLTGPQSGTLGSHARFTKHGVGCIVHIGDTTTDFDFGPGGETDGFDAWRLFRFSEDHGVAIPFQSHREINEHLLAAEAAGELSRLQGSTLFRLRTTPGPTSASGRRADARGLS